MEHPLTDKSGQKRAAPTTPRQVFIVSFMNMSWQLTLAVLVPVIGGVQLDKVWHTSHLCLFVGLAIALIGSALVMRRAMHAANALPVPKLTAAQKAAIKKQYEEEDEE